MRFKFTIFLLGLNLAAFGLIAYLSIQDDPFDQSSTSLSAQISREIIEADRIELRGSGLDQARVLTRSGANWQITQPMQWKANYFAINRILNQLQFIEQEASFAVAEILSTGQSLADYGLEEPVIKLVIAEGEASVQLSIGTLTDIGNNVYLLGPDRQRIFVVGREVIDGLLVDLSDLRNREIFDIPVFEVNELSLQIRSSGESSNGDLKVRLANKTGQWRFEAPLAVDADPALVSNTINTLASLQLGRFVEAAENDPTLTGLDSPFMRITLHGNKRRQTLLIGKPVPATGNNNGARFFARLEENPVVFTVEARPFEDLLQAQESLRERNFMSFDAARLNAVYISEHNREIRLQKIETGDWQVLESSGSGEIKPRRADPAVMQALIRDLRQLRAQAFAVDAPSPVALQRLGFNTPRRNVRLQFDAAAPLVLELAHPEDENDKLYAKISGKEAVYEVDRRTMRQLLPLNTLHYRNRLLDTLPQAAVIQQVSLKNLLTGETSFSYRTDSPAGWLPLLEQLETRPADAVSTLLQQLRKFGVKTYLSDQFTDGVQLDPERTLPWAYRLQAEVLLPGGETGQIRTLEYVFTERLAGTMQIGGSAQHNTVFELNPDLIEALYQLSEEMPLPPEALGAAVPQPESPEPVPMPEAATAPEGTP